jgi:DNA modification methylase
MMKLNKILQRNVLDTPWPLEDNSVDCCVTSPPYWGLRDYKDRDQIGLEKSPEEYVQKMVRVFNEVYRVLKPTGTLWLNLGDSYAHNGAAYHNGKSTLIGRKQGEEMGQAKRFVKEGVGLKPKDLVGIPWMVAFALRSAGWYLRQDIIWAKPNPMPESVTDRCTKSHEYIFLLSKSHKYYFDQDAIRVPLKDKSIARLAQDLEHQKGSERVPGKTNGNMKAVGGPKKDKQRGHSRRHNGFNDRWDKMTTEEQMSFGANKRSVWTVSTKPFQEAHFATFPEELITPCILAGCPKDGVVLDCFMGAGTTALVAMSHGRKFIGFELNPEYIAIANKRLKQKFGMFHITVK